MWNRLLLAAIQILSDSLSPVDDFERFGAMPYKIPVRMVKRAAGAG
ncbi:MAG: hypothetical protein NC389_17985 [Acetatifactor muris]|nr:hypothetical protein [Acetatifactor muris]